MEISNTFLFAIYGAVLFALTAIAIYFSGKFREKL